MRILIKQVNWLGDLVMTLPATTAVRQTYPEAHLALLVRKHLAGFYDGLEWIDEVIGYHVDSGLRSLPGQFSLVNALRPANFDTAVIFPRSFRSALWMRMAGIPKRVGYVAQGRGAILTHRYERSNESLSRHQVNDYLDLVRQSLAAQGSADDFPLSAGHNHVETMKVWLDRNRRRGGRIVALATAAAYGPAKEWPAESYARLIAQLDSDQDTECVLVGAPHEQGRCDRIAKLTSAQPLVAAGQTSVGELIALLSLCDGFVGNDSGPMHVAGALGVPTVGIFGSTNPNRTGPLGLATRVVQRPIDCSPCLQRYCRFGHYECLRTITVGEVVGALENLWSTHLGASPLQRGD